MDSGNYRETKAKLSNLYQNYMHIINHIIPLCCIRIIIICLSSTYFILFAIKSIKAPYVPLFSNLFLSIIVYFKPVPWIIDFEKLCYVCMYIYIYIYINEPVSEPVNLSFVRSFIHSFIHSFILSIKLPLYTAFFEFPAGDT